MRLNLKQLIQIEFVISHVAKILPMLQKNSILQMNESGVFYREAHDV